MDLEQTAIERLRMASDMSLRLYKQPLVITYSGGKDSDVLLHLAGKAGIPYEVLHSLTTADAPETVYHVKNTFRKLEIGGVKCTIDTHKRPDGTNVTMWNLIPRKLMPPTRFVRYCCAELKEGGGKGRWIATGVRWEESQKRKSRGVMEALQGFARYPKIKAAYIRAFDRMLAERQTRGRPCDWQTGEDVMHWWMEDGVLPGQMVLEGMEDTP